MLIGSLHSFLKILKGDISKNVKFFRNSLETQFSRGFESPSLTYPEEELAALPEKKCRR
jgi:hypothetical protein